MLFSLDFSLSLRLYIWGFKFYAAVRVFKRRVAFCSLSEIILVAASTIDWLKYPFSLFKHIPTYSRVKPVMVAMSLISPLCNFRLMASSISVCVLLNSIIFLFSYHIDFTKIYWINQYANIFPTILLENQIFKNLSTKPNIY